MKSILQAIRDTKLWAIPAFCLLLSFFVIGLANNAQAQQRCEGQTANDQNDCVSKEIAAARIMPVIMMLLSDDNRPDLDEDGIPDDEDDDIDGDGFPNELEQEYGTDPADASSSPPDFDGDKIPDDIDDDRDGDGISNEFETQLGTDPDDPNETPSDLDTDGIPDALDDDRDGDGISNEFEIQLGTDPDDPNETPLDSDTDGIPDALDDDRDGDGFTNEEEDDAGTDPDNAEDSPDAVAPILTLNNLVTQTESDSVFVTGVATDPEQAYSGLQTVRISSSQFEGVDFSAIIIPETGGFRLDLPLRIGVNVVTIVAIDLSGNESVPVQRTVTRVSVPQLVNLTPANGTVFTEDVFTITGDVQSELALEDLIVRVNGTQLSLAATGQANVYHFEAVDLPLTVGDNNFDVEVDSVGGEDQATITVTYTPDDTDNLPPPIIAVLSPSNNALINQESFLLSAQIESAAGPLTVSLDGNVLITASQNRTFYNLSEIVSFAEGQNQLSVTIEAVDSLGRANAFTATFNRDDSAPILTLNDSLLESPAVNQITDSPYQLSGTVSDDNLSSLLINDQSVQLSPGADQNTFDFSVPITVNIGDTTPVAIAAFDRGGNRTELEIIFENTSSASIKALLPTDEAQFIANNAPIVIQLVARVEGLTGDERVVAFADGSQTLTELSVSGTLASTMLDIGSTSGEQTIRLQLRDSANAVLNEDTITVTINNSDDVPVELIRVEPQNNANHIEANAVIEVYFNRDIDLSLLEVEAFETLQGKTYLNADELGVDFINTQGYQLTDVNRTFEPIPGQLELIPGDSGVTFSASRFYGYNADVFVEISYNGEQLSRHSFRVRELPTFINGAVVDQFGQPIAGIEVALPELDRTTTTNGDGGFAFGYQETGDQLIPGGRYNIIVNSELKNPSFGTINKTVSVQRNYPNDVDRLVIQELDRGTTFYNVTGGGVNNLAQGDLIVDLSSARVLFANGRTSGALHAQFVPFEQLGVQSTPSAMPLWMFSMQPKGVTIEGDVGLSIAIPKLRGSYDYINADIYNYVVLLGYNQQGEVVEPIGVGQIENLRVNSVRDVELRSFDYIGYALLLPSLNSTLERYANGEISLQQLKAALTSIGQ